ncbi:MAG: ribosomal protection-like ABC-F family protein [Christensenellales bacterium]|jgi:macrolide transport system ATP-binding/permease protein
MLLSTDQLTKQFHGVTLLDALSLAIYPGEKIGLIGANGAGKSTLMRILAGELEPDSGRVTRNGTICYIPPLGDADAQADGQWLSRYGVSRVADHAALSGGERRRIALASAASHPAPLTLADEPTASLDRAGIETVTRQLQSLPTLLLISHDRALLDAVCTTIWLLEGGKITVYPGSYSDFIRQREAARARQQAQYEDYVQQKAHLTELARQRRMLAAKVTRIKKSQGDSRQKDSATARSKGTQQKNLYRAAKSAQSRMDQLEAVAKPETARAPSLDFARTQPPISRQVVILDHLTLGYEGQPLLEDLCLSLKNRSHTALVGPNGCGKTTLMRAIAQGHPQIRLAPGTTLGYFGQNLDSLDLERTVFDNAMRDAAQSATVACAVLAQLGFGAPVLDKAADVLSGGERVKLALAKLVLSPANVLLLDEPTNYLDLPAIQAVQQVLRDYPGTWLLVSHDRALVDDIATHLWMVEDRALKSFSGNLTDWEQRGQAARRASDSAAERLRLQMQLSNLSLELQRKGSTPELEQAYQAVLAQLRQGGGK